MNLKYLSAFLLSFCLVLVACDDEDDYSISKKEIITQVTTGDASVTATSAIVTGVVKDLSGAASSSYSVGAYYGTEEDPTINGTKQNGSIDGSGNVTTEITDLTPGTTYYYATFVTLQSTVTTFGEVKSFVATDMTITTNDASDVSCCKANITGSATNADVDYTLCVKYSLTESGVVNGKEAETGVVAGLLPGQTYYYAVCAKVGDSNGYVMGATKSLKTESQDLEYVDLGLSVRWATTNVGAEEESEIGALIGYGDITALMTSTVLGDYPSTDIAGDGNYDIVSVCYDQANMPSAAQFKELISGTTQTEDEVDGVKGLRFTAENGNSIFLPYAGYREGDEVKDEDAGHYWSGSIYPINNGYGQTCLIQGTDVSVGFSSRYLGLSVRPVEGVIKASSDQFGDIEGNGNFRIQIYNVYGNGSAAMVDPDKVVFSQHMAVTFTISGLTDNLNETAYITYTEGENTTTVPENKPVYFVAGLEFADTNWSDDGSRWSGLNSGADFEIYDAPITGDGKYTVWMETSTAVNGTAVFCIDIKNLSAYISDMSKVAVQIDRIAYDKDIELEVNNGIVSFCNKDGDGVNGRIDIYNEYGDSGSLAPDYYSSLKFNGMMIVDFTISGITSKMSTLSDSRTVYADLSYADADWSPAYWGEIPEISTVNITGDGTYQVKANMNGDCVGAICWTIELYNLWEALGGLPQYNEDNTVKAGVSSYNENADYTGGVTVKIDKVTLPGKQ